LNWGTISAGVTGLVAVLGLVGSAAAQDTKPHLHQRLVIVSIPDRQLAALEEARVPPARDAESRALEKRF